MGLTGVSSKLAKALRKPKTRKGKRVLEAREGLVHENPKNLLVLRGTRTNPDIAQLLQDITDLRKPLARSLQRKQNEMHPFENAEPVEYLSKKNDCSLFAFGSSSKKRPCRLILGRMFNSELLDMQEFKVSDFVASASFPGRSDCPQLVGQKPLLVFQGPAFDHDEEMKQTKSLLLDVFRGATADKISLMNLTRVIVITAMEKGDQKTVLFKHYSIAFKKSGTRLPHTELSEVGPRFTLSVDRRKAAVTDTWKLAMRTPKELKPKKQKNVTTNVLGQRIGKVHLGRQDIDKMHTPHFHGSKGKAKKAKVEAKVEE